MDSETLETAATTPASATVDGTSAQQRSLPDLIAMDRYLSSKQAAASRKPGIRFAKLLPPGMT